MPGKRFTRGEARSAVLSAGLELLVERGSSTGLDRVSFAEAIERSGVPRPSAYRAFGDSPADPQDHFREELAYEVIEHCSMTDVSPVESAVADLVAEAGRDDISADELTLMLREVVRLASTAYPCHMAADPYMQPYMALVAASRNDADDLTTALQKATAKASENSIGFYRTLADTFGIRLRCGWTWEAFAAAVSSLENGEYLSGPLVPHDGVLERPTGPNGEIQQWTRLATMVEGLVIAAFEPNPRMVVSAVPADWSR